MDTLHHVVIVSSCQLMAAQLAQGLEDRACRIVEEKELADPRVAGEVDLALIVPTCWEELARWRSDLRRKLGALPWVFVCDLRIPGAFLSDLPEKCAMLEASASLEEIRDAIDALEAGKIRSPAQEIRTRYTTGFPHVPGGDRAEMPSRKEMQCLCGLSLGWSDHRMATLQGVEDTAVKSALADARPKVPYETRDEILDFVEQVFRCSPPPKRSAKLPPKRRAKVPPKPEAKVPPKGRELTAETRGRIPHESAESRKSRRGEPRAMVQDDEE